MKQHTTIICLSLITIIAMFTGYVGISLLLWGSYAIYKILTSED